MPGQQTPSGSTSDLQAETRYKASRTGFYVTSVFISECVSSQMHTGTLFCRNTTCNVLLQLSDALPACELQRAGVSALQRDSGGQIQAKIIADVERVGECVPAKTHNNTDFSQLTSL